MSNFATVEALAAHLRQELESKKYLLLFAYNGTGKTRLSMAFKNIGKKPAQVIDYGSVADPVTEVIDYGSITSPADEAVDFGNVVGDTLYFNAFTEDLFSWDNDLDGDSKRVLRLNKDSKFFKGLEELEMENRIRPFLHSYTDFDFEIDYKKWEVVFKRRINNPEYDENILDTEQERTIVKKFIKVSRGEENLFIWCFFLAIAQLAIDGAEAYKWVKYIFIDDPISSLDENNAIKVGHNLVQLFRRKDHNLKVIISSHHALFFNVIFNELRGTKFKPCFLAKIGDSFGFQVNELCLAFTKKRASDEQLEEFFSAIESTEIKQKFNAKDLRDSKKLKQLIIGISGDGEKSVGAFLENIQPKLEKSNPIKKYKTFPWQYQLRTTGDTPFFHHVATLIELWQAAEENRLYTHHFHTLRTLLEKSASFHGYEKYDALIGQKKDDPEGILRTRMINVMSHSSYSLYEPKEMLEDNKLEFKEILNSFMDKFAFNPELFAKSEYEEKAA